MHAGLVGARIVRLGRATVNEALAAMRPLIARDNEMGVAFAAPILLVMLEVLHGLGWIDDLERVPWCWSAADGGTRWWSSPPAPRR